MYMCMHFINSASLVRQFHLCLSISSILVLVGVNNINCDRSIWSVLTGQWALFTKSSLTAQLASGPHRVSGPIVN